MKKLVIIQSIILFISMVILAGCSENEPHSVNPSQRDGVYEGKNLTFIIDGEIISSVKSVRVLSELLGYGLEEIEGTLQEDESNPVYHSLLIIKGLPGTKEEVSLNSVSTLYVLDGKTNRLGNSAQHYVFTGKFSGDPYSPHKDQSLTLEFTSINPAP